MNIKCVLGKLENLHTIKQQQQQQTNKQSNNFAQICTWTKLAEVIFTKFSRDYNTDLYAFELQLLITKELLTNKWMNK